MAYKVRLDRAGVGRILRSAEMAEMVNGKANQIAAAVRLPNDGRGDVVVEPYTTDRGAASVVARHPAAAGLQAKYGIITVAASAAGVTVRRLG